VNCAIRQRSVDRRATGIPRCSVGQLFRYGRPLLGTHREQVTVDTPVDRRAQPDSERTEPDRCSAGQAPFGLFHRGGLGPLSGIRYPVSGIRYPVSGNGFWLR